MKNLYNRIFNRWTKWEVHEENKHYHRTEVNNITGYRSEPMSVICDVMKKTNNYTGMIKYKIVTIG